MTREDMVLAAAGGLLGAFVTAPVLIWVAYRIEQRQIRKHALKRVAS